MGELEIFYISNSPKYGCLYDVFRNFAYCMAKDETISILGCGWLGLPLAEKLIEAGYKVKGSTTTAAKIALLAQKGIEPFLLRWEGESNPAGLSSFLVTDFLIIAFPPGLRAGHGEKYLDQIAGIAQALANAPVTKILFISSTSVYPDLNRIVTEEEDLRPELAQNILLRAENLIASLPQKAVTILRFSGLVGGERHPGRFLAGKQNVANPAAPVNLIHLDDCISIILAIFENAKWGALYNACADEHPTRQLFYTAAARQLNVPAPQFAPITVADKFKIISNKKIKEALAYEFIYPDPMLFL